MLSIAKWSMAKLRIMDNIATK